MSIFDRDLLLEKAEEEDSPLRIEEQETASGESVITSDLRSASGVGDKTIDVGGEAVDFSTFEANLEGKTIAREQAKQQYFSGLEQVGFGEFFKNPKAGKYKIYITGNKLVTQRTSFGGKEPPSDLAVASTSALAGAQLGSQLGSVVPVVGNVIGSIAGGVAGAVTGILTNDDERPKLFKYYIQFLEAGLTQAKIPFQKNGNTIVIPKGVMLPVNQIWKFVNEVTQQFTLTAPAKDFEGASLIKETVTLQNKDARATGLIKVMEFWSDGKVQAKVAGNNMAGTVSKIALSTVIGYLLFR